MAKSMLLITSNWNNRKSFRLIPATQECIYNECIFDLDTKVLAIIGKEKKESFHILPKLNEFGDLQRMKVGKRENGKDYAEERKSVETFYEYYIEDQNEIIDFIKMFAKNEDGFDYKQFFQTEAPAPSLISSMSL
jgi:hypothetical protein